MDVSLTLAGDDQGGPAVAPDPGGVCSPGVAWLRDVAVRAALVERQVADGQARDDVLTLHGHHATRMSPRELAQVVDDLGLPRCAHARATGAVLADAVVLFRAAVWLLDILTTYDPLK